MSIAMSGGGGGGDDGADACSECETFSTCLNCSNRVGSILSKPFNITVPTALPFRSTSPATGILTANEQNIPGLAFKSTLKEKITITLTGRHMTTFTPHHQHVGVVCHARQRAGRSDDHHAVAYAAAAAAGGGGGGGFLFGSAL